MSISFSDHNQVFVKQQKENIELLGVETKNKYSIETESGQTLGYAAETGSGFLSMIARQILRHWRKFEVEIFNEHKERVLTLEHPFRFYFTTLNIDDSAGRPLGVVQRRFSLLRKKFEVRDASDQIVFTVDSPLLKVWNFPFKKQGKEVAEVTKKWGGLLKEAFLDADTFLIDFKEDSLTESERTLVVAASFYIDILYFEENSGGFSLFDIGQIFS